MAQHRYEQLRRKSLQDLLLEHPQMTFDKEIARRICDMHGIPFRDERLDGRPTVMRFLESLQTEESRVEFLSHYIVDWEIMERQLAGASLTTA